MKKEMLKLLSINNDKLIIERYDLEEIANMYYLSARDFLTLFKIYLTENRELLNGEVLITNIEKDIFIPNNEIESNCSSEILVTKEEYEKMKKIIFDFAYIKCSKIGDTNFKKWTVDCVSYYALSEKIKNLGNTYSCIYKSSRFGWDQKTSNILIDKEDQEKRYSLIKGK